MQRFVLIWFNNCFDWVPFIFIKLFLSMPTCYVHPLTNLYIFTCWTFQEMFPCWQRTAPSQDTKWSKDLIKTKDIFQDSFFKIKSNYKFSLLKLIHLHPKAKNPYQMQRLTKTGILNPGNSVNGEFSRWRDMLKSPKSTGLWPIMVTRLETKTLALELSEDIGTSWKQIK